MSRVSTGHDIHASQPAKWFNPLSRAPPPLARKEVLVQNSEERSHSRRRLSLFPQWTGRNNLDVNDRYMVLERGLPVDELMRDSGNFTQRDQLFRLVSSLICFRGVDNAYVEN
jgi:hypothetical protein